MGQGNTQLKVIDQETPDFRKPDFLSFDEIIERSNQEVTKRHIYDYKPVAKKETRWGPLKDILMKLSNGK